MTASLQIAIKNKLTYLLTHSLTHLLTYYTEGILAKVSSFYGLYMSGFCCWILMESVFSDAEKFFSAGEPTVLT